MSVQAIGWVLEHSEEKLAPRLVLLALANHAGPDGSSAFPSIATIQRETRLSHGAVCKALDGLRGRGAIRKMGRRRHGTVVYAIVMAGVHGVDSSGVHGVDCEKSTTETQTVHGVDGAGPRDGHEPSLNLSLKPSGSPVRPKAPKGAGPTGGQTGKPRPPQNLPQAQGEGCPFSRCDGSHFITDDETRTARRCECHPNYQAVAA